MRIPSGRGKKAWPGEYCWKYPRLSRTAQNGGFSWQQGGASPNLSNPALPGGLSVEEAYTALQSAGLSPQMIQEVLESNGYFAENLLESPPAAGTGAGLSSQAFSGFTGKQRVSPRKPIEASGSLRLRASFHHAGKGGPGAKRVPGPDEKQRLFHGNALARPSAQQAYNILKAEGFSPETSRYLLESNGYSLKGISEKTGYTPELDSGPNGNLLENGWEETFQLPDLLDDGEEDLLQKDESSSGEMLELPKTEEEFSNNGKEVEKYTGYHYNENGTIVVTDD